MSLCYFNICWIISSSWTHFTKEEGLASVSRLPSMVPDVMATNRQQQVVCCREIDFKCLVFVTILTKLEHRSKQKHQLFTKNEFQFSLHFFLSIIDYLISDQFCDSSVWNSFCDTWFTLLLSGLSEPTEYHTCDEFNMRLRPVDSLITAASCS